MNEHKSFFDKFNFSKSEKKNEEETNTEERTKYEERVKDIYHRIENKNCINCNKFSGHTDDGENGFCGEECRNSFLKNGDPLNEAYLKAALLDLDSSVEKQGKNHAFMMQKLATCLEKEMCPNCDKDWNTSETDRGDGFCSDTCRDEFMKKDPHNERYLKEAEENFDFKRHSEIGAKRFNISEDRYRQLSQVEKLTDSQINKILDEENAPQMKKAA